PGFAAAAIASLAIGIAGNAGMFSLVHAVILKPLAYRDPGQLVLVSEFIPKVSNLYPTVPVTANHVLRMEREVRSFESVGALIEATFALTGTGEPERLGAIRMSHALFGVLGIPMQIGRSFTTEEDQEGAPRRVIISNALWRRKFSADPAILGKSIQLNSEPYEVIGVTRAGTPFPSGHQLHQLVELPERADLFFPIQFGKAEIEDAEGSFDYAVIARLRNGVKLETARAELEVLFASVSKKAPMEIHGHLK